MRDIDLGRLQRLQLYQIHLQWRQSLGRMNIVKRKIQWTMQSTLPKRILTLARISAHRKLLAGEPGSPSLDLYSLMRLLARNAHFSCSRNVWFHFYLSCNSLGNLLRLRAPVYQSTCHCICCSFCRQGEPKASLAISALTDPGLWVYLHTAIAKM